MSRVLLGRCPCRYSAPRSRHTGRTARRSSGTGVRSHSCVRRLVSSRFSSGSPHSQYEHILLTSGCVCLSASPAGGRRSVTTSHSSPGLPRAPAREPPDPSPAPSETDRPHASPLHPQRPPAAPPRSPRRHRRRAASRHHDPPRRRGEVAHLAGAGVHRAVHTASVPGEPANDSPRITAGAVREDGRRPRVTTVHDPCGSGRPARGRGTPRTDFSAPGRGRRPTADPS
jgi:hypothetical protein